MYKHCWKLAQWSLLCLASVTTSNAQFYNVAVVNLEEDDTVDNVVNVTSPEVCREMDNQNNFCASVYTSYIFAKHNVDVWDMWMSVICLSPLNASLLHVTVFTAWCNVVQSANQCKVRYCDHMLSVCLYFTKPIYVTSHLVMPTTVLASFHHRSAIVINRLAVCC